MVFSGTKHTGKQALTVVIKVLQETKPQLPTLVKHNYEGAELGKLRLHLLEQSQKNVQYPADSVNSFLQLCSGKSTPAVLRTGQGQQGWCQMKVFISLPTFGVWTEKKVSI